MKRTVLAGLIAAALGSGCERMEPANVPTNVPVNGPGVNVAPVRPQMAGPVYVPPAPKLSLDEQLAQKTPSANIARYVLNNTKLVERWSETAESDRQQLGDAVEIVEGDAVISAGAVYFQHRETPTHKSTVYMTPRVIETGGKYKLALETIAVRNGEALHILLVDEGLDGKVDKGYEFKRPADKPVKAYKARENDRDNFIFHVALQTYRTNVLDKKQH